MEQEILLDSIRSMIEVTDNCAYFALLEESAKNRRRRRLEDNPSLDPDLGSIISQTNPAGLMGGGKSTRTQTPASLQGRDTPFSLKA